ncbi:MAG TPA: VOC family protein [Gemmatimonadaceae bacterium]|jgi:hypothetical protein|nr:VOC family protein [Gemmatimonadaceae bacterium]
MAATGNHGRFIWHELMTKDSQAAQKFYTEVVGWSAAKQAEMDYTVFSSGDMPCAGLMDIPEHAAAMGARPAWLGYVEVDDVDATIEHATRLGGSMLGPAQTVPGVGRFAVMRDPQAAAFGIVTSEQAPAPEEDPRPLEFSWHELTTTDVSAAVAFYGEIFGWEKKGEFDMGPAGVYHMFGRDRFTYGGMFKKSDDMPMPPNWLLYARVSGTADAAADRAKNAGAQVFLGPMDVPGGDRVAAMMDPQGAAFAVHQKAPAGAEAQLPTPGQTEPTAR